MELSVKANVKELQAMFRQFPREVRMAAVSALNKTGSTTKTAMYKRIKERRLLTMSAADIKSRLRLYKASTAHLTTTVSISGKPIPLNQFKTRARKDGVYANVIGAGYKGPVSKYGNKGFTNRGLGGGTAIFVRTTGQRLPIEKMFGPSLPSAITAAGWDETILQVEMAETWQRNIINQLQWRLAKYAA